MFGSWREFGLAATAAAALAIGVLVYLLDRPAGSAYLLAWTDHAASIGQGLAGVVAGAKQPQSLFGAAGAWLPSFVHALAFGVLTSLVLPTSTRNAAWACGFWAVVDTAFEVGQHPVVAPSLVQEIGHHFDAIPVLDHLGRYFANGVFDVADIVAGMAGAGLAFLAVVAVRGAGSRT